MASEPLFGRTAFAFAIDRPSLAIVRASGGGYQRLFVSGEEVALCPGKGPYVHYSYTREVDHGSFFTALPALLKSKGCKLLSIRLPPSAYYLWADEIAEIFRRHPTAFETQDLNYHLPVRTDFAASLPSDQRRVLRRAGEVGYRCELSKDWVAIRDVVSQSRMRKGFSDAVPLDLLLKLDQHFHNYYQGIVCYHFNHIAGAGVLIRVDDRIAYLFYVANHPDHLAYSPSLQIIDFCMTWAHQQGFRLLDLGTASNDGIVNEGVKAFKESLGGIASIKSSFRLVL